MRLIRRQLVKRTLDMLAEIAGREDKKVRGLACFLSCFLSCLLAFCCEGPAQPVQAARAPSGTWHMGVA